MNLEQLAKETDFTEEARRYYLAHLKEIDALDFVVALCEAAYEQGFAEGCDPC